MHEILFVAKLKIKIQSYSGQHINNRDIVTTLSSR